jgi:hypothetical protein
MTISQAMTAVTIKTANEIFRIIDASLPLSRRLALLQSHAGAMLWALIDKLNTGRFKRPVPLITTDNPWCYNAMGAEVNRTLSASCTNVRQGLVSGRGRGRPCFGAIPFEAL